MIDVGHALHGRELVRWDESIPAVVLEIGPIVQQPFRAGRLVGRIMLRLGSRVLGGFAYAVRGPNDVCSGRVGRIDGFGLVVGQAFDGFVEMGEQPVGRTVRVAVRAAEKADRVEEMMQPRRKRIQTNRAWRVQKNQSIDHFALPVHLQRRFVRHHATGGPAAQHIRTVRLSPPHFGEVERRHGRDPYGKVFRALEKRTVQAVNGNIITDGGNLSIGPANMGFC